MAARGFKNTDVLRDLLMFLKVYHCCKGTIIAWDSGCCVVISAYGPLLLHPNCCNNMFSGL